MVRVTAMYRRRWGRHVAVRMERIALAVRGGSGQGRVACGSQKGVRGARVCGMLNPQT